jgi:nicotinate-nucleotide adenylyltransferase
MNTPHRDETTELAVCLFGGSFDPVHCGHVALAKAAHNALNLDRVVFVPGRMSPHKTGTIPAPAEHRLAMLRLAIAGLPWALVSTWEIERAGPSYSWETAEHFAAVLPPGSRTYWLLGADQWQALDDWARPEVLARRLHFIVFPRGGAAVSPKPGFDCTLLDVPHPASSTAVRAAVAQGRDVSHLVPTAVADYIERHGLYRTGPVEPSTDPEMAGEH